MNDDTRDRAIKEMGRKEVLRSSDTLERITSKYSLTLPADYHFAVAHALLELEDTRSARRYLRQGLLADKKNTEEWLYLAQTYFDARRPREALRILERAIKDVGDDPKLLISKGMALDQLGNPLRALQYYDHESVMRSTSRTVQSLRLKNRAATLDGLGEWKKAIGDLKQAYRLEGDPSIFAIIAGICLDADRPADALRYASLATKKDDRLSWAWNTIGIVRAVREDYMAAIQAFRKASRLEPREVRFLLNLAHALTHAGRYRDAIACSRKVLHLDPKSTDGYIFWARALMHQRKTKGALRVLGIGVKEARGKKTLLEVIEGARKGVLPRDRHGLS